VASFKSREGSRRRIARWERRLTIRQSTEMTVKRGCAALLVFVDRGGVSSLTWSSLCWFVRQ